MEKINTIANIYYRGALIKGTYEFYSFYERILETGNPDQKAAEDLISALSALFTGEEDYDGAVIKLDGLRRENMRKVEALSSFTDILKNYEYVLNRLEQRYKKEPAIEEAAFIDRLMRYIFSIKDNVVINENIKECIGQLPVRMTKQHYFDRIRDSLSLYKGNDSEALSSYLYMLRMNAMLCHPEESEGLFPDIQERLKKFYAADLTNPEKEEYEALVSELLSLSELVRKDMDFYLALQEVINSMYTVFLSLTMMKKENWEKEGTCLHILKHIYQLVKEGKREEILPELTEKLIFLEGQQEKIFQKLDRMDRMPNPDPDKKMEEIPLKLEKMGKLMSSSMFADLEEKEAVIVTEEDVKKAADDLIRELTELFHNNPKTLNRAVMAGTLANMPVFFNDAQEVLQYIKNSLEQCGDESEKNVSMKLLCEIMDT